ncbi:hypothetical protein CVT25_000900 [Psilocybe cyanescens]|uniref:Uncharacterized protein n=1 Tax=Psilocybe cyanescens TaxID=93625 RepID=A0A409WZF5_PSICY|nr:hypothetical protein CVT25_000900 [Psilocybe cyanescens]
MLPPTSHLPPIKYLGTHPLESLEDAVRYLRLIYNPPVRGSRRRNTSRKQKDRQTVSNELNALRTDAFERGYSIKWLTALISQCGMDLDESDEDVEAPRSPNALDSNRKEILVEDAASLLAMCAGTASAGVITRRFVFDLENSSTQISVDLTDVPLDNQDYGSVGAQTWGGACIMAEMMAENPDAFCLPWSQQNSAATTLRCLELGAGTGLVSLTAAKIMERIGNSPFDVDIVATDYYPSVLANLARNIQSNLRASSGSHICISTQHLDWSIFCDSSPSPAFEAGFDVVYGADIIYEAQHATWIKSCLEHLLRKPSTLNPNPTFHLIIPLRATHSAESNTIEQVFPFPSSGGNQPGEEGQLVIKHKETIICDVESDKDGEEVEYAYYKIGWS